MKTRPEFQQHSKKFGRRTSSSENTGDLSRSNDKKTSHIG